MATGESAAASPAKAASNPAAAMEPVSVLFVCLGNICKNPTSPYSSPTNCFHRPLPHG